MKILVNERLSKNKMKTSEGYLICTDAILARTGKQQYRKSEIWQDCGDDADEIIDIDRPYEEVFSEATLASFENKPITVEHPDVDVNTSNYKDYAVGFVRDVHQGKVDGQDVILGTLVITDQQTIEEIENGEHTDLSCGYDCDIVDENNPHQTNIRGNHVALCQQGRAGIARIVDSANVDDANKDVNQIIKYFEVWGYPVGEELQEAVDFYKLSKKDVEKIFGPRIGRTYDRFELTKLRTYDEAVVKDVVNDSIQDDVALTSKQWIDINKVANRSSYTVQEINNAIQKLHQQKPFLSIDECVEVVLSNIKNGNYLLDSIQDVEPRSGESEEDFIKRFMSETKNEYPDHQQRLAVAYSYWRNRNMKDMIKDAEFTLNKDEKLNYKGHTLYRVYYDSTKGGWIESEGNIKKYTKVLDEAKVYGNATIGNSATISEQAEVYGNAEITDSAKIFGQAEVYGNAVVKNNAEVSGQAKVYGYANIAEWGEVLDNAKVYGNAEIKDSGKVKNNAKVYGSATINGGEAKDNAEVYGNAKVQGTVKDNAKVCGNAFISGFSKVYGRAIVDENANIISSEIYGNAQIYGNATVGHSKIFGNAMVKDYAKVEKAEIQGMTVVKGNMNVSNIKISSNKDLENAGIKDSINDSYVVITIGQQYSLDTEKFRREMAFYGLRCEFGPLQGDSRQVRLWGTRQQLKNASYEYPAIEYATVKDSIKDSSTKDATMTDEYSPSYYAMLKSRIAWCKAALKNPDSNAAIDALICYGRNWREEVEHELEMCKIAMKGRKDSIEDSAIAVKDSTGEQFDILKVPGDGFVYLQSRFDKRLVKSYEDNFKTKYTVKKV